MPAKKGGSKKGGARRRRGRGVVSDAAKYLVNNAGSIHNFVKDNNLVSKGLDIIGQNRYGDMARSFGYGRRRHRGRGGIGISMPFGGLQIGWGQGGRGILGEDDKVLLV